MADRAQSLDVGTLVSRHHAELYRYAFRLSGSAADAEDLTQQTFLVAQQKLDQVRSADSARGWLFAVLRNLYLKSRQRPVPLPAGNLEFDLESVPEPWPEVDAIDREAFQQALLELPDEFKLVVLMFYFEQQSYRQIADALSIPIGTVMSRLSRAKNHLRQRLTNADAATGVVSGSSKPARSA